MTKLTSWVIFNGSLTSDKFSDQANMIHEALTEKGVQNTVLRNHEVMMSITKGASQLDSFTKGQKPDFVVFLDKDILLAKHLELCGIKVYNSATSIENCDNKATMFQILANHGLPMPETIIAPKVYKGFTLKDKSFYDSVIQRLGFPLIIKEVHGSFGMKVYLIHDEIEFFQKVEELNGISHIYQKFIQSSYGRDVRINVVGDEVVASMYRYSSTDFRANVTNGGKMSPYEPTEQQKELAIRCTKILGAYFSGVDLLFDENEGPIICEVNANSHIRNIFTCTGVNVAEHMADYILKEMQVINK